MFRQLERLKVLLSIQIKKKSVIIHRPDLINIINRVIPKYQAYFCTQLIRHARFLSTVSFFFHINELDYISLSKTFSKFTHIQNPGIAIINSFF